jgi:hypothetical protein
MPVEEEQEALIAPAEKEGEAEMPAAALPEEPPAEPEEEGTSMLQMAPSLAVTATETALADTKGITESPMGRGLGETDAETAAPEEELALPAGSPEAEVVEVVPPTPAPLPNLEAPATRAAVVAPTSEVLASEAIEPAEAGADVLETRTIRAPAIGWLRVVEYVLGVALILLIGTTLTVVVWRRMMG